jgi:hypothetical protein
VRHFRSILYATVLAPAVWVLCGLGFTHDLIGRARDGGGVESLTGLLLLLSAGAAYSILLLAPISPAGPLLGGVVFFGVAVWAVLSPPTYASLWSAAVTKDTFDLSLPGYGLAVLLAVPLIATALSARRWERYEPPKVPVIGTLGQSHGVARPAGIPLTLLETATMQKAAETPDTTQVVAGADGADETIVMRTSDSAAGSGSSAVSSADSSADSSPESSTDEPVTEVVRKPADEASDEVTATFAVSAAGEVTATGATVPAAGAEPAAESDAESGAQSDAELVAVETARVEPDSPEPDHAADGVVVAVAAAPDVDTTEIKAVEDAASADAAPQAEAPQAEAPQAEAPQAEAPRAEAPQDESSQDEDEPVTARVGERAADERTAESGTDAAESDVESPASDIFAVAEAVQDAHGTDEAAVTEAFAVAGGPEQAEQGNQAYQADQANEADQADQADQADEADDGETTDVVPTRATAEPPIDEDEADKTQVIQLPIGELATHDLRNRRIPGEGPTQEVDDRGRTPVFGPGERTQVIARGPDDETQVIRLPGPRTPGADGERTQVIRLGSNTVEPPGDRTQVLKLPVADEPTADRREPPPSILHAERPNPGDDPTTRLVVPDGYDESEEITADVGPSKRRIMTVMNLERPVDEVADDTRRLVAPPPPRQRRPQDDD